MMSLAAFVEKTPGANMLFDMIAFAAERRMEIEVGAAARRAPGMVGAAR